uniref:Uncharacterized protein n=1 Tax=Rhizophora mucronata TaxID=61149 RepID=A0A2P2P9W4_RHIMU
MLVLFKVLYQGNRIPKFHNGK